MSDIVMRVSKTEEAGYESALLGLSFNKKKTPDGMKAVARKLAFYDGGHNKFLESIYIWLEVRGPRYWWQEADTYRLSTKQSESTMHTLKKELIEASEGEDRLDDFIRENFEPGSCTREVMERLFAAVREDDLVAIKKILPEGFIQRRLWCMSYKTLRNIISQRKKHRLPHWREFIKQTLEQVEHPEILPGMED